MGRTLHEVFRIREVRDHIRPPTPPGDGEPRRLRRLPGRGTTYQAVQALKRSPTGKYVSSMLLAPEVIEKGASSSCGSVRIDRLDLWLADRKGASDCADEVILARKGAKSRRRITGLRSTGTKMST